MTDKPVSIGNIELGPGRPLALIAGPCVIEDKQSTRDIASELIKITTRLGMPLIFKASFDKANRTSIDSFRGPGLEKGLDILAGIREEFNIPVLSDIHRIQQAKPAGEVLDVIQIPAFLSRQTDLIMAAAATGKALNIKKGQFLSPRDMINPIRKARAGGAERILLTERGTMFGYSNLVVDMRGFGIMREFGCPLIFDATHSVQLPGGQGHASAGERQHVAALARSAVAAGVDGVFMEVHPEPDRALCDGANSLPLEGLEVLLTTLQNIHNQVGRF